MNALSRSLGFALRIELKEALADGDVEYKYYAEGVGVARESPADGDVLLKSHVIK